MSEKRRDSKNRILRKGESQGADGRYQYRYTDPYGQRKAVYSWRLVATDPIPAGKRDNLPLREQIKRINRDLQDLIAPDGGQITVLGLVKKYINQKRGVKLSTQAGYGTVINFLEKEPFGARKIDQVRLSDAKEWLIKLQREDGKSYSSLHTLRGVLRPAFQMAVDDDIIRKNPFDFLLATVVVNDSVTREALTRKEERAFLDFIKGDKHYSKYYDGMYILFKTGLRISEFVGLTLKDVDLENRTINIDHQLQRTGSKIYIDTTKTSAGKRVIPMQDDVYECFRRIIARRKPPKVEPMIDGYSGFLWFDKDKKPMVALHWEKYFQHAVEKYNRIYQNQLPKITPHVCRYPNQNKIQTFMVKAVCTLFFSLKKVWILFCLLVVFLQNYKGGFAMDLSHLQGHYEELLNYMEQKGYSDTYVSRFRKEIQRILKRADDNAWESYRDIYKEYEQIPHSNDYLRNKRTIIGALEQFDINGFSRMDGGGIHCLTVVLIIFCCRNSKN